MLATRELRVALATTHLPLKDVPDAITAGYCLTDTAHSARDLTANSASAPRIAVLGLNPHAGEGGHMGREEIDTIMPVWNSCAQTGMDLIGPCRPTPPSTRKYWTTAMRYSPCTTTRGCRCSSTRALAGPSISPWACPSSAPRWTMVQRWIWPVRAKADWGSLEQALTIACELCGNARGA